MTQKWALQWLPCQAPDVIGSVLGVDTDLSSATARVAVTENAL